MTAEVRGSWRPAALAIGRIAVAQLRARGGDPVWTDDLGTLTRAEFRAAVRERRRRLPEGAIVVHDDHPRTVALTALAGLLAGRGVTVVPIAAGQRALRLARASATPRAGIRFATSGTTGPPRLPSTRSGPAAVAQRIAPIGLLRLPARPVVASLAPVDHGHGFVALLLSLIAGGHFVAASGQTRTALGRVPRVDLLTGVPLQLREFATDPRRPGVPVGMVLAGSDLLDPADAGVIERGLGCPLYNAYGATETGTLTLATPADRRRSPGTVGRPLAGVRIREVDGRLEVRSPVLGRGHLSLDLGEVRDGLVHVTGRADDRRVSGGVTVGDDVVTDWLAALPGVAAVHADWVPDARFGQRRALTVMGAPPWDEDGLRARIREEFGAAATPARLRVLAVDERTP